MGKAAKLESRPENANRANPELRALGHQTPGRAEWGKKTRTRQNGSSCEQQSRSSLELSMMKGAHVPRMARQRAQERTDRSMVNPERFSDLAETVRVSNFNDTRPKRKCAQTEAHLTMRPHLPRNPRRFETSNKPTNTPNILKARSSSDATTRARQHLGLPHFH